MRERSVAAGAVGTAAGWRVLIVWECACRAKFVRALADRMEAFIRVGAEPVGEIGRGDVDGPGG